MLRQIVPVSFADELQTMMALLQIFCNGRVSGLTSVILVPLPLFGLCQSNTTKMRTLGIAAIVPLCENLTLEVLRYGTH